MVFSVVEEYIYGFFGFIIIIILEFTIFIILCSFWLYQHLPEWSRLQKMKLVDTNHTNPATGSRHIYGKQSKPQKTIPTKTQITNDKRQTTNKIRNHTEVAVQLFTGFGGSFLED